MIGIIQEGINYLAEEPVSSFLEKTKDQHVRIYARVAHHGDDLALVKRFNRNRIGGASTRILDEGAFLYKDPELDEIVQSYSSYIMSHYWWVDSACFTFLSSDGHGNNELYSHILRKDEDL